MSSLPSRRLLPILLMPLCLSGYYCTNNSNQPAKQPVRRDSLVEAIPAFDGATCLICVDIFAIANKVNLDWAVKASKNPGLPNFEDSLVTNAALALIDSEKVNCPPGSKIKIQFLYHHDPKPVWKRQGGKIVQVQREESDFVDSVLIHLRDTAYGRVAKIYLACCESESKKSNIDNALKLDSVTHVITNNHTIHLICGVIEGSQDCDAGGPDTVRILVYEKKNDTTTKFIPSGPIPSDKKFDVNTNTVKNK